MEDFLWRLLTVVIYCAVMLGIWLGLGWVIERLSFTGQLIWLGGFGLFMLALAIRELLAYRRRRRATAARNRNTGQNL